MTKDRMRRLLQEAAKRSTSSRRQEQILSEMIAPLKEKKHAFAVKTRDYSIDHPGMLKHQGDDARRASFIQELEGARISSIRQVFDGLKAKRTRRRLGDETAVAIFTILCDPKKSLCASQRKRKSPKPSKK